MISRRSLAILALALPCAAASAQPEQGMHSGPDCPGRLGHQEGAPLFADYPAPRRTGHYVAPQLTSREVRAHRSTLGAEAANGPNFAANYTIAAWGCGFSCSAAAAAQGRTRARIARLRGEIMGTPSRRPH
jgi:hypothetical protein